MLTKVRKKQLDTDLWIIAGVSLLILVIYTVFGREINHIAADTAIPIVLRVLFMGGIFQFGIALSALCCVPDHLYNLFAGKVHTWFPFSAVPTSSASVCQERSTWTRRITRRSIM